MQSARLRWCCPTVIVGGYMRASCGTAAIIAASFFGCRRHEFNRYLPRPHQHCPPFYNAAAHPAACANDSNLQQI